MNNSVEKVEMSEQSENVAISSKSSNKLMDGFQKTLMSAASTKQRIEEAKKDSGSELMCNSCGRKFKTVAGVKRHLSAKNGKCSAKAGYREIPLKKITKEDRALDGTEAKNPNKLSPAEMSRLAAEATAELRGVVNGRGGDGNKITSADLNRCPTVKLEDKLRQADSSEILKFASQRFHPANASRKYLAEKELEKRK